MDISASRMLEPIISNTPESTFSSKIYGIIDKLLKEKSKSDDTVVVHVLSLKKFVEEAGAIS